MTINLPTPAAAAEAGTDRAGFFFATDRWSGIVRNAEPEKCSDLVWADPADLPVDAIAYPAAGISQGRKGVMASTFGFPTDLAISVAGPRPDGP